jgi:ribosomal protein S12 methylthiotransferase accessory factor
MLRMPTFKKHYDVAILDTRGVLLRSDREEFVIHGSLYARVARCMTGECTTDEITARLRPEFQPAEVFHALEQLEEAGCLTEAGSVMPDSVAAFWDSLGVDPAIATRRLADLPITVHSVGNLEPGGFTAALEGYGFSVSQAGKLTVVLTDNYLRSDLQYFNERALQTKDPWLLASAGGTIPWVGPLFVPGETACWRCLADRLGRNRPIDAFLFDGNHAARSHQLLLSAAHPTEAGTLHEVAAALCWWLVTGSHDRLVGTVSTFDTVKLKLRSHFVPQRPQCPACGDATLYTHQVTRSFEDPSHSRTEELSAIGQLSNLERPDAGLLNPVAGVVRRLRKLATEGSDSFHVYIAEYGGGLRHDDFEPLVRSRQQCCGKGATDDEARACAIFETIERYSGVFQGDEPRIVASANDLGDEAVDPNSCMLISDEQYEHRDAWNAHHSFWKQIPLPLDPDAPMEWTPVWSLTEQRHRYLPTTHLYYDCPVSADREFCRADSNGNAAGATLEDATLRGFLELVERDSVALWWYNRIQRPALDLASAESSYGANLLEYYRSMERELWVLDLTSDLGIATFAAVSPRLTESRDQVVLGFGAHLDPAVALMRALNELNQVLAVAVAGRRGDLPLDSEVDEWLLHQSVDDHHYLLPEPSPTRQLGDVPCLTQADLTEDLRLCRRVVEQRGMQMLVLDQTRPDIGVPVAKVVVPGLRHFWARLAPGRLYDTPVAMGWLRHKYTESELNPVPLFM